MEIMSSTERGLFQNDWLKSYHSFSFGDYYNPHRMGYLSLRVINHDFISGFKGFPMHSHKDMEILTYVLKGEVSHSDSMGNEVSVKAGEAQLMRAGTGISHSEWNKQEEELELLQIWVTPFEKSLKPTYYQKSLLDSSLNNNWFLLASEDGRNNSFPIAQDILIWSLQCTLGNIIEFPNVILNKQIWLQVASGKLKIGDYYLSKGDAWYGLLTKDFFIKIESLDTESKVLLFMFNS